jgi:DNA-3-methyladenine glycosylase
VVAEAGLEPLPRDFFARDTEIVARALLGAWLVRRSTDGLTGGPIVETEAYGGPADLASHARSGRTRRTAPMFGEVGHAYVYLVYGMHECVNVVAYDAAVRQAGAVLIRAIEPRLGVPIMRARRGGRTDPDWRLAAGPARLCQALGVTRAFDGHDLTAGEELWLAPSPDPSPEFDIAVGPRVGVDYAGEGWKDRPWRFWIVGSRSVSKPPRAGSICE